MDDSTFTGRREQRLLDLKSNGTPADGCTELASRDLYDAQEGRAGPLSPRGFLFYDDASDRRVRVLSGLATIRRLAECEVAGLVGARSGTPYAGSS